MDSSAFRRLRRNVLAEHLEPLGFALVDREYSAKRKDGQIWFMRSVNPGVADHFAFEVGLHLEFVAPFKFTQWPGARPVERHGVDGCFLSNRVYDGEQHIFSIDDTSASIERSLVHVVKLGITRLKAASDLIKDGTSLFALFPPEALQAELDCLPYQTIACQHFPGWQPNTAAIGVMLCHLSRYYDKKELLQSYVHTLQKADTRLINNSQWFLHDLQEVVESAT